MKPDRDVKSLSQSRFSRFADGYVTSKTHAKGAELDKLIEITRPRPDWLMMDVATGGGHTALKFAPYVERVVAGDISPAMLDAARAFAGRRQMWNIAFLMADAEDLPFQSRQFDLVTCRVASHHFPDCARFVQECARVLKEGGLLLVQDHVVPEDEAAARYVDDFERLRDPSHNRAYSESEWFSMFRAGKLVVEHHELIEKRHNLLQWAALQSCSPQTVDALRELLAEAPPSVREWLQPRDARGADASFSTRHIIISGRASGSR